MANFYSAHPVQRGYGFGSFLKGISSFFAPLVRLFTGNSSGAKAVNILKKVANHPIAKKSLKKVKKEFVKSAGNVVSDLLSGENLKQSVKSNSSRAIKNVGQASLKNIKAALTNNTPKKKQTKKHKKKSSKRKRNIFDN